MFHIRQKISCPITYSFFSCNSYFSPCATQTQPFEDCMLCKDMHVLLNKCLAAGSQARFDVIIRYTFVRIMIECDRCQCSRLIEHFP